MKLLRLLFSTCALLLFALMLSLPGRASDATDYTVTVSAGVNPTTIFTGQSATGSATATITGNNPGATQELTKYSPSATFSILSVKGTGTRKILPSASIHTDGSNLIVTAGSGILQDTYTVTIQATYTWEDNGNTHSPSGTTTVSIKVIWPFVKITLDDHVQAGHSISGTIALYNPASLPNSLTIGLFAENTPPPYPQTDPVTPPATGMVTVPGSVTVPGDGTPVSFTVTGASVSSFLNDVYVTAGGGATSSDVYLTVWSPGPAICTAIPASDYYIVNDGTNTAITPARVGVNLTASAGITPPMAPLDWLAETYPSGTKVGMVQNVLSSTFISTYSDPTVIWNVGVAKGTVGYAYSGWTETITVPSSDDTSDDNLPYPHPYAAMVPITQMWSSNDSPVIPRLTFIRKPLYAADYTTVLGSAVYTLQSLSMSASFTDWCCIYGSTTQFPATTGWSVGFGGIPPVITPPSVIGVVDKGPAATGSGGGSPIVSLPSSKDYLKDYLGINPPVVVPSPPTRLSFPK